jgi:hypothetical protein
MWKYILALFLLFVPIAASAPNIPRAKLFAMYAQFVNPTVIAQRMEQMFTNLPSGAVQNQARTLLLGDLNTALGGRIAPLSTIQSDLADTTLATPTPSPTP